MRTAALVTQPRGGPVDHAVDVACELAARGHESSIIGPVDAYAARLDSAGVRRHDVDIAQKVDVRGMRDLRSLLRMIDPDVLHCQDRRAGLVGRLAGRGMARRIVYTVHGVADSLSDLVAGNARAAPRRRLDGLRYLRSEQLLDRLTPTEVVVVSHPVERYVIDHAHFPAERVHVVPNGIDAQRFAPPVQSAGDGTTILWLGMFAPVKRVDVLLRAVARIPAARLVLAGDGPERAAVETLVDELALRDRVELRGFVGDPVPVFAEAQVFALPSAAEGLPIALLQAMSCGLPAVATRVGGIPDVVRDGVDGLLVPPDDVDALTAALEALLTDAPRRSEMAEQARARVLEQFTLSRCVDDLLAVYTR